VATLSPSSAYPLQRESMFTEPLPSKWCSASGFQAVFIEPLIINGHIRHNTNK
jgi:hypothetical protein